VENFTYEKPEFERKQKIEIYVEDEKVGGEYVTFLEDPRPNELIVQVPVVDDLYLPVGKGREVKISYSKLSARYEFESRIKKRSDTGAAPFIYVLRPDRVKRIQMRDYLRVPCSIEARMEIMDKLSDSSLPQRLNGKIVDISGGGLKFETNIPMSASVTVELFFELDLIKERMAPVLGRIVRRIEDKIRNKYFLAVEFEGLTIEQRNSIIQYTYQRQLELGKKDKWVSD
jgi:c-di-GMP-binding flagellar brake protein YcgR